MRNSKKRIIALLLVVAMCAGSSGGVAQNEGNAVNSVVEQANVNGLNYTLEDFCVDLRLWNHDEKDIQFADAIVNGQLYVDINITEPFEYQIDCVDWNMEVTASPATFQLYLQSLGMIKFLSRAALLTNCEEYLDYAWRFIQSWEEYAHDEEKCGGNTKVWYDHGTALRAENLIYFLLVSEKLGMSSSEKTRFVFDLLVEHGEFLSDEQKYTKNHNHGIFQDEALFYIAYLMPEVERSKEWEDIAKTRLRTQLEYAFTDEWVHVENSATYCVGVISLFYRIASFLENIQEKEFSKELTSDIEQMTNFVARLHMPSGQMAVLGDSFIGRSSSDEDECFDNSFLEYVQSKGKEGKAPENNSAYYPKSGYFFTNETYDPENYEASTWFMFKAGYVSATHKHADDLEILLYSKGHEIFIDPGMYNYMNGDPYRDYLISPRAHNTINVDGKTYSTTAKNCGKTGLLDYREENGYQYVLGFNDMYSNVEIDRHVYSMTDAIVLFDDVRSQETHEYSQLFHLSEDVAILERDARETLLSIGDTPYRVRIRQYGDVDNLDVIRGAESEPLYGFASSSLNEVHEINTLKYEVEAESAKFITLITVEDSNGKIRISNDQMIDSQKCEFDADKMLMDLDGNQIVLTPRQHLNPKNCSWSLTDGALKVISQNEGGYCAWYVIDKETGEVIYKSNWENKNEWEYPLQDRGILVKAYTRDALGQRRDAIIGGWETDGSFIPPERLNYVHLDDQIERLEQNKYQYTAGVEYDLDYRLRWYVYRNGSYYTVMETRNEDSIELDYSEPGSYTVSYYVNTQSGDNEYWSFPAVIIE